MFIKKTQLLILTLLLLIPAGVVFCDGGPAKPEAAQFQPVDATDLVSLLTGNFTYNLPLLEVPGPEGSWPINLCYQAGVGPNTEPTWVGLGWTLNPGAINRFVNGYPDDYYKGAIRTHYEASQNLSGSSIGMAYGPFGMSLNFDSYGGVSGWNASMDMVGCLAMIAPTNGIIGNLRGMGGHLGVGLDLNIGSSGVGMAASVGMKIGGGLSLGGSIGLSNSAASGSVGLNSQIGEHSSLSLLGASFSSHSSPRFTAMGAGSESGAQNTSQGTSNYSSSTVPIPIGLAFGIPLSITIGYWSYHWELNETYYDNCFGSIMQQGVKGKSISEIWGQGSGNIYSENGEFLERTSQPNSTSNATAVHYNTKMERTKVNDGGSTYLMPAVDNYSVSGQGISGSFQPFFTYGYYIEDEDNEKTGKFSDDGFSPNYGSSIQFRFNDEPGGNFFNMDYSDPYIVNNGNDQDKPNTPGSKIINPVININTGVLEGFRITTPDGKIYEFFQPVLSINTYTKNYSTASNYYDEYEQNTPYASSWLLTAVKGPDYVDRGLKGFSTDDWGYWVKFNYNVSDSLIAWRTPVSGGISLSQGMNTYSTGVRTSVMLKSIETATHVAIFSTSPRIDDIPAKINDIKFPVSVYQIQNYDEFDEGEEEGVTNWRVEFNISVPFEKNIISFANTSFASTNPNFKFSLTDNKQSFYLLSGVKNLSQKFTPEGKYNQYVNFTKPADYQAIDKNGLVYLELSDNQGLNTKRTVEKLDNIVVKKKLFDNYGYNEINTFANANPKIEGVNFSYNYSLVTQSIEVIEETITLPGKLTLTSVQKSGLNGDASLIPPTNFTYYNQNDYSYNRYENADYWNGYTSGGNYFNVQNNLSIANNDAAEWSLKTITTPLGSNISIEYETDRFASVGGSSLVNPIEWTSQSPTPRFNIEKISARSVKLVNASDYNSLWKFVHQKDCLFVLQGLAKYSPSTSSTWAEYCTVETGLDNNLIITFSKDIDLLKTNNYNSDSFDYYLTPQLMYGGGHRVRTIALSDGEKVKKTSYLYGCGYTACLPAGYSKLDGFNASRTFLANDRFNDFGVSPTVMYKNVSVIEYEETNVNNTDQNIISNGKMSYTFCVPDKEEAYFSKNYDNIKNRYLITDKTAMIGKLIRIDAYAQKLGRNGLSDDDFYIIKSDQLTYCQSSEVCQNGRKVFLKGSLKDNIPLGVTTQGLRSKTYESSLPTAYEFEILRYNVYPTETISQQYFYTDQDQTFLQSGSQNIGFDYYSGDVLVTAVSNSDDKTTIVQKTPAYWKYPDMMNKNMISQVTEVKNYIIPAGVGFYDIGGTDLISHLTSASVTTWKKWAVDGTANIGIWRQDDQYSWVGGSNFTEFDWVADHDNDDIIKSGENKIWQRTSNITAYDKYSHPVEERNSSGIYISSLYGYGEALPVAIVTNAKIARNSDLGNEASFLGFDTPDINNSAANDYWGFNEGNIVDLDANSHTGVYSCKIETGEFGPTRDFLPENQKGKYVFSCWVRSSSANNAKLIIHSKVDAQTPNDVIPESVNGASVSVNFGNTNGKWEYRKVVLDLGKVKQLGNITDTKLRIRCFVDNTGSQNSVYIDDIRFHPVNADMSTFTYHPFTQKVTAITDKNNITSYYEYDNAGRLKIVRDQDKAILKRHSYHYNCQYH